jgi:hypothetical protein
MTGSAQSGAGATFIRYENRSTDLPDGQISGRASGVPVQPRSQKYFCFSELQIKLYDSPSHPTEGRVMIVAYAG